MWTTGIRIDEGYVHYRKINYPMRWLKDNPGKGCPLCNKEFEFGDLCYMTITNGTFPSTIIHQSCVDHDLILTTHALSKSYRLFEEFNRTHKGWN